jgi:L-ascorbate metabolism protein UlaG (beta-lactamase superfamily)
MLDVQDARETPGPIARDSPVYLKPGVQVEPLFCGWLVWPHLLAPVPAAMNIAFRYLPLLQSFVSNPMVHTAATRDPKMFGGPFVHLAASNVPQVRELIATTKQRLGRLLKLAEDLKALDASLQDGSKGFSLNEVYARLPQSLAGMVELLYDINNHPRIHLLEELLYAEYGADLHKDAQEIAISAVREADRRFFMSTPRIRSAETLIIPAQLSDPALDVLASMRLEPIPLRELEARFGLSDLAGRYEHLFNAVPPARNEPDYTGDGVRIRYFGHACVMIQTRTTVILIDPMFASEPADPGTGTSCNRFTVADVPDRIDYLVLTHGHQDHFCAEMLLQIRPRVRRVLVPLNNRGNIADPSMKLILARLGFTDVTCLGHFDSVAFECGKLVSIPFPGEHSDLDIYSKQSVFLRIGGRKLLFLADSDGWDVALYRRIATQILNSDEGPIDALFLGMECFGAPLTWLYGPLLSKPITRRDDESRRLSGSNCERALRIVQQFKCDRVYVYAMGQEPWLRYLMGLEYGPDSIQLKESDALVKRCRSDGLLSERLYGSRDILI